MKKSYKKSLAILLSVVMLLGMLPMSAFAAVEYTDSEDGYYNVVSKKDWELAPGIEESEIVLNNDEGTHRQVAHVVEVDIHNEYTKVMPSYKGMAEGLNAKDYGVQTMDKQVAYAEANGYGNVVAAMNLSLSWYNSAYYNSHPELVGEPLGYIILDGVQYTNSQGVSGGAQTCLVINFDEKDGEARPSDIPKTEIRSTSDAITGWEEQVIPANFGFLVKDGVNQYSVDNNSANGASRSFVGIKEDGTIVMVMNDGRQSPYSIGFTNYEMAEFMLSLGCVYAINGDGGGSSQFLSQRPGEEMTVNCSPSDGALRDTTHGILVISTAPSTGEFVRAHIDTEDSYYTPGASVQFTAVGADLVGAAAEIPAEAVWQLSDSTMGTIDDNGLFVSNGTIGSVKAQLVYNDKVVGEHGIDIVIPEKIAFSMENLTVPYGESVDLEVKATYGVSDVVLKDEDIVYSISPTTLGIMQGNKFTATEDTTVTSGTITATFGTTDVSCVANVALGKASLVFADFEDGNSAGFDLTVYTTGITGRIYSVTEENGKVHNGNCAYAMEMDYSNNMATYAGGWMQSFFMNKAVPIEGKPTSFGAWVYLPEPEEIRGLRLRIYIKDLTTGKSVNAYPVDCGNIKYEGWQFVSADLTSLGDFTSLAIAFQPMHKADVQYGSSGYSKYTLYFDDFTFDYSTAVADREAPTFGTIGVADDTVDTLTDVAGQTLNTNTIRFGVKASENTTKSNYTGLDVSSAKAYIDGIQITDGVVCSGDGNISVSGITLPDGPHNIRFEISDNAGNMSCTEGRIVLDGDSTADTINVVPANPNADMLPIGSLYWLNLEATAIEKVQSVTTKINLNTASTWELDYMELAEGFTSTYEIDEITNNATITITKTGEVSQTGNAALAKLPIRTWESDRVKNGEYTVEQMWDNSFIGPVDIMLSTLLGKVTYIDDTSSSFAMNPIQVDTELFSNKSGIVDSVEDKTGWHQHTAEAIEDKEATCTESGYTDRTYCEVCASVVDWGTVTPATGHSYDFVDGTLKCDCDKLFNGIYTDGKTYVDGVVIADGWVEVDGVNTYYYLDGVKLTGSHFIEDTMYTFDDSGVYLPNYIFEGFYDTSDGKKMYFINNNYVTGRNKIGDDHYTFDDNGYGWEGVKNLCGYDCTFDDGLFVEDDTVLFAGTCGRYGKDNVAYVILKDGRMIFDGEGETEDFGSIGVIPWYDQYRSKPTSVYIGKDITTIGIRLLYNLDHVSKVEFERGSKLIKIKEYGMGNMINLKTLQLPEGVQSLYGRSFQTNAGTWNLTITIPKSVTMIGSSTVTVFGGVNVTFKVLEGSYAHTYATEKGIESIIPVVDDVDDDGSVNLKDLVTIARYMADWDDLSINTLALDANGDGVVDLADVNIFAQRLAGWPV